jgi:heme/copper-type cytochrome/quinol oxidase subunit 2
MTTKTKIQRSAGTGFLCLVFVARGVLDGDIPARVVEVIADSDNTFKIPGQKKPVIAAKPGELLSLRITSKDGGERARDGAVHSFVIKTLRDQGWDIRLMPGTRDYKLAAPTTPGTYLLECTVKCGRGHDDMNMKLIVK